MLVLIVIVIIVTIMVMILRIKKKNSGDLSLPSLCEITSLSCEELELLNAVGQGRFATVHRARQEGKDIAVKIFTNKPQAIASWEREKAIYSTPNFGHPSILGYHGDAYLDADANTLMIGGKRRQLLNGATYNIHRDTYWLVFDYHSNGSLYDYLQRNIISLEQFCDLAESAACGLAYLHGDDVNKSPIAHRDLKSKNILVKSDLTCVISDFGLAVKLVSGEPKVENNGQVQWYSGTVV